MYIELKNMKFRARHGVFEQERTIGNEFTVDLKIGYDLMPALKSDNIEDALNYAEIYSVVKAEMAIPSNLLENVAGRILSAIRQNFPATRDISIRIAKLNPPLGGEVSEAAIEMTSFA